LAKELDLFVYSRRRNGEVKILDQDVHSVHEAILAPKYNFSAPRISISELRQDGTLVLRHDHGIDGRGLDLERTKRVLEYIHRIWKRPVKLYTLNARGDEEILTAA
jgi:stage V sporulation protein R